MDPYMYHSPVDYPMTNTPSVGGLGMFYDKYEGGDPALGAAFGFGYGGIGDGYANYSLSPTLGGVIPGVPNQLGYPAMGAAIGAAISMATPMTAVTGALAGVAAGFGLHLWMMARARREGSKPGSMASQVAAVASQSAMSAMSAIGF